VTVGEREIRVGHPFRATIFLGRSKAEIVALARSGGPLTPLSRDGLGVQSDTQPTPTEE
jgi:hypothetical protein